MKLAIFLPGLQLEPKEPNLEKYALRLRKAIDINDPETANKYELKMSKEKFGPNDKEEVDVATIKKISREAASALIPDEDIYMIYKFDYASLLVGEFEQKSLFSKFGYLIWTMVTTLPRFVKPLWRKKADKTLSNKYQMQALYVFAILILISIWVVSLLPSAITTLIEATPDLKTTLSGIGLTKVLTKFLRQINFMHIHKEQLLNLSKFLLSISAFIYLLRPGLKSTVGILSTEFLCLDSYLRYSARKPIITGKFDDLLEYILERHPDMESVEIHSYSFGSIVSYDVLFPFGKPPSARIELKIDTLITIGSPHDFVKNYYPKYFTGRGKYPLALSRWYNIYSKADILSSNFRNDDVAGPAAFAIVPETIMPTNVNFEYIQPDTLNWWDTLRLYTLKIHSGYWDSDEDATSCLTNLVQAMNFRALT